MAWHSYTYNKDFNANVSTPNSEQRARRKTPTMQLRIRIREQLCLLIALTALLSLMVLSVSVWVQSHRFILRTRAHTLEVTASLKADQLAQDIALFRDSVVSMTTRENLQAYVKDYNDGNTTDSLSDDLAVSPLEDVSTTLQADPSSLTSSMLFPGVPRIPSTCKPPCIQGQLRRIRTSLTFLVLPVRARLDSTSYQTPIPMARMSIWAILDQAILLSCTLTLPGLIVRSQTPYPTMVESSVQIRHLCWGPCSPATISP